jgi:hypothetical protein
MSSDGSHSRSTSKACPNCGVDMDAALKHVDTARRRLQLLQEKLEVEQELLKQDKRNFRRRLQAAKASASKSRKETEARVEESKQALELASRRQREYEQEIEGSKEKTSSLQTTHQLEIKKLKDRMKTLESLQEAKETDRRASQDELQNRLEESQLKIQKLQEKLDQKQSALDAFEMQLLEMERERDMGKISDSCSSCVRLDRQVEEQRTKIFNFEKEETGSRQKIADGKRLIQNLEKELEKRDAAMVKANEEIEVLTSKVDMLHLNCVELAQKSEEATGKILDSDKVNQLLQAQLKEVSAKPATSPVSQPSIRPKWEPTSSHRLVMEFEWFGQDLSGVYTGWINEEKDPDGIGTLRVDDGAVYDGSWKGGERHGEGVYATIEGDIFRGGWYEDKHHGPNCVFVWSDGRVYQGAYSHGDRHGEAIMTWPHGATFRGTFSNDKRNGQGTYVYSDGRCYNGNYRDERPHGYGVLKAADGETIIYEGQWEFGEFIGPVEMK